MYKYIVVRSQIILTIILLNLDLVYFPRDLEESFRSQVPIAESLLLHYSLSKKSRDEDATTDKEII